MKSVHVCRNKTPQRVKSNPIPIDPLPNTGESQKWLRHPKPSNQPCGGSMEANGGRVKLPSGHKKLWSSSYHRANFVQSKQSIDDNLVLFCPPYYGLALVGRCRLLLCTINSVSPSSCEEERRNDSKDRSAKRSSDRNVFGKCPRCRIRRSFDARGATTSSARCFLHC
jgi:hypothetical protein